MAGTRNMAPHGSYSSANKREYACYRFQSQCEDSPLETKYKYTLEI